MLLLYALRHGVTFSQAIFAIELFSGFSHKLNILFFHLSALDAIFTLVIRDLRIPF